MRWDVWCRSRPRRGVRVWLAVGCLAGAVGVGACGGEGEGDRRSLRPLRAGDAAPEWRSETLAGEEVAIGEGLLLLNVWATWCIPCRQEMPDLQALHEEFGERGLTVVGVSIDGGNARGEVERFLGEYGITFGIVHDPEERVTREFRTVGVPETFLVDGEGVVLRRWIGPVTAGGVRGEVERGLGGG